MRAKHSRALAKLTAMYVIGTAGHVDHGKSLLVERLTGIDPDRLEEEKRRGMTVDLGFAWMTLPSGRPVSIIDVPGHERFIKNMLAGAGGIDLALLVIAADDGVMPQTREHLAILDLLGVRFGVIALTKVDLVEPAWRELVRSDIDRVLRGTSLDGAPVVACSAISGDGLAELQHAIDKALDTQDSRADRGRPRLPIDRVFTIDGFGTVVTGTLSDGALRLGDEVEVMPGALRGRVRGLQSHQDAVERVAPGMRAAVNLSGITKDALHRGQVLARPGALTEVSAVDVRLRKVNGTRPVRHNMHVTFHTGAAETLAQVRLLEVDELGDGDEAWGQIKFADPLALLSGDRFVIRTPDETIAGGEILAVNPRRHRRRDARVVADLARRAEGSPIELVVAELERARIAGVDELAAATGLSRDVLSDALATLRATGTVLCLADSPSPRYILHSTATELHEAARDALTAFHERHPLRAAMPLEEMRAALALAPEDLGTLAAGWTDVRIEHAGAALAGFVPTLNDAQARAADEFLSALRNADPPGSVPATLDAAVLQHLVATGRVVDAAVGVLFERTVFDNMADTVRTYLATHDALSLGEARTLLGTNRKFAQAFLEHLDRLRLTRRVGDVRVWR